MRDIEQFRNWARSRFPFLPNEQIEDMAAHVQMTWLEGKRLETKYIYLAIDFLRKHGKRIGQKAKISKYGKAKDAYQNHLDYLDEVKEDQSGWDVKGVTYEKSLGGDEKISEVFLNNLKNLDRAVIILFYVWGLSMREIGEVFGVSESRVSQRHANAMKQIKKGVAYNELKKRNK